MEKTVGIAGQVLSSLGRASINVRAIAQGASEKNISVIVDNKDAERALSCLHFDFVDREGLVVVM